MDGIEIEIPCELRGPQVDGVGVAFAFVSGCPYSKRGFICYEHRVDLHECGDDFGQICRILLDSNDGNVPPK